MLMLSQFNKLSFVSISTPGAPYMGAWIIHTARENTGLSKRPFPTTQEMTLPMDIMCQYLNQIDYILCSQRWRSSILSVKTRPGTDCGSDRGSDHCKIQASYEESKEKH